MAVRLTQEYVEVLNIQAPIVRFTQLYVEVLNKTTPTVRHTQTYIEVLQPSAVISEQNVPQTLTLTQTITKSHVVSPTVTSTLTLSQTALSFRALDVTSTLTLSQTQTTTSVFNREVTSTLSLSQNIGVIRSFEVEVENTLNLTHSNTFEVGKFADAEHTIVFSQTIDVERLVNKAVFQNLYPAHIIGLNKVLNKSINSSLVFTQTVSATNAKAVKNTLTFTQTVTGVNTKGVKSTLEFNSLVNLNLTANRTILSYLQLSQQIQFSMPLINRAVSQTLTITQIVIGHAVKAVAQTLSLTQSITVLKSKPVKNTLNLVQTIGINRNINSTLTQNLALTQTITLSHTKSLSVTHVFSIDQYLAKKKVLFTSVTNNLNLSQNVVRERFFLDVESTLDLTQTISKGRIRSLNVSSNLLFDSQQTVNTNYTFSIIHNLIFKPTHPIRIGSAIIEVPNVTVVKAQRYFLLKTDSKAVTLPNAEWGDGEGNTGKFTLKRAVNGKVYTYVKNTNKRKLNYTFTLGRQKSIELREFLRTENTKFIELHNWKGEIWITNLITNPPEFSPKSRGVGCYPRDERVEVSLEFEGIKVN